MDIEDKNYFLFDCRNYIKPGDEVIFNSMAACPTVDYLLRRDEISYSGKVIEVYENYVIVKLLNTTECANRWDITAVNNKKLRNQAGYFQGLERITT